MKTLIVLSILGVIALIALPLIVCAGYGVFPFGPINTVTATVERLYVNHGRGNSHYMAGTDAGVFEIDNSLFLWIWNSDEIYSSIAQGGTYTLTTKGNKVLGWWFQSYPYIIKVEKAQP